MKAFALVAALAAASVAVQELPPKTQPADQHAWLKQLVGEWDVTSDATPIPGVESTRMEASEKVRAIGDLWIVADSSANLGGMPFSAVMTLGYDTTKQEFVGTWIDSMQPHLWTYRGKLDEARKVLTLESEGPNFTTPGQTSRYRDVIEITGPASRTLTSSMLGEDGTWTTFARAEYRRKE